MEIYNYDENGFYISTGVAEKSPLEEDVYLIPAFAIDVKVLDIKEGFLRKFDVVLKKWEYIEIPQPIPETVVETEPTEPTSEAVLIPEKITRLQAKLELLEIGLYDKALLLLENDKRAFIYWNDASYFYRNDEILLSMATAINIDFEQLNTLFINASKRCV